MVGAGQVKGAGEQGFLVAMLSVSGIWLQHSGMATFGEVEVYVDSTAPTPAPPAQLHEQNYIFAARNGHRNYSPPALVSRVPPTPLNK